MSKIHELFVLALSLVWFAGRLLIVRGEISIIGVARAPVAITNFASNPCENLRVYTGFNKELSHNKSKINYCNRCAHPPQLLRFSPPHKTPPLETPKTTQNDIWCNIYSPVVLSRFCIVKWKRGFRCSTWWSTRWSSQLLSSRLGPSLFEARLRVTRPDKRADPSGTKKFLEWRKFKRTFTRTNNSGKFWGRHTWKCGFSRQKGPESSPELCHEHCHGISLPYFLRPRRLSKRADFGRGGQQLYSFQSPAVHWMGWTSSLNCLS